MVNSLWTNFLVVFRDELSYTGYSVKDVPIRTRPAFSNGPLCSIVSLKLRVRKYTLKFPFFFFRFTFIRSEMTPARAIQQSPSSFLEDSSTSSVHSSQSFEAEADREQKRWLWEKSVDHFVTSVRQGKFQVSSPLYLQEDLASSKVSSKVSSVKELRESKFLGSVIDERDV